MKTFRVCLSSELPSEMDRSPDYLYFAYDTLELYSGQNYLEDNFAIVEEIPEEEVYGMIYILNTDGSVHRIVDYADTKIAEIEDPEQIEILKKAGTMFYVNARHRYIDSQRRVLTLPFNDGSYELNVSTKKETVYDNNTILKYNTETERFEIYSDTSEDFIDFSKPFRGSTTNSVEIKLESSRIVGNVRISETEGNMLRVASDGLMIPSGEYVPKAVFDRWVASVLSIKTELEHILDVIQEELEALIDIVDPENLHRLIMEILEEKYPDIDTALENYDEYVANLDSLEDSLITYAAASITSARDTIIEKIESYNNIEDLDSSPSTYKHEIDYYEKAKNYFYPVQYAERINAMIAATMSLIFDTEE